MIGSPGAATCWSRILLLGEELEDFGEAVTAPVVGGSGGWCGDVGPVAGGLANGLNDGDDDGHRKY